MKHEKAIKEMEQAVTDFLQTQIDKDGTGLGYFKHCISKGTGIPNDILTAILKRLKDDGKVKLIQIVDQFSMPAGSGYCLTNPISN